MASSSTARPSAALSVCAISTFAVTSSSVPTFLMASRNSSELVFSAKEAHCVESADFKSRNGD